MKPLIIDLYCGMGGAAEGYHRAGFDVIGVDLEMQRNYPFPFMQADVLDLPPEWFELIGAAAVHASPPCQFATALNNDKSQHLNLIPQTRALLVATGLPWIIENVVGARPWLKAPTMLCGSMFGLGAEGCQLERHRLFETSGFTLPKVYCNHGPQAVVGVYGGHARVRAASRGGRTTRDPWPRGHRAVMREALGIEWGTCEELSEAIPPAYTDFIGKYLYAQTVVSRPLGAGAGG